MSKKLTCNPNALNEINRLRRKYMHQLPQIEEYNTIKLTHNNVIINHINNKELSSIKSNKKQRKLRTISNESLHTFHLQNNGNICYCNATLQALLSLNQNLHNQVYI